MKVVTRYIEAVRDDVEFWIGENAADNFSIIDAAKAIDLWFHVSQQPSCHVIAVMPQGKKFDKKQIHKIVVQGALLCKQHSRFASVRDLSVDYAPIANLNKTDKLGCVTMESYKSITL
jgi:predicted ribosome quality control (RQC) complex YloA/Tae2 family protein